uniref:AlNc14C31G2864 protein n=1 Tax=Albugo laibachii Nc14 TaxID=890382 RepID=F0W7R0_9STRA|nr:AlNc14C31G2864 [Albugo laibachii Nc14]|eukprot:CCA17162.1 AlNc14C31G2864 [Albugo laibachii Nc14]
MPVVLEEESLSRLTTLFTILQRSNLAAQKKMCWLKVSRTISILTW